MGVMVYCDKISSDKMGRTYCWGISLDNMTGRVVFGDEDYEVICPPDGMELKSSRFYLNRIMGKYGKEWQSGELPEKMSYQA